MRKNNGASSNLPTVKMSMQKRKYSGQGPKDVRGSAGREKVEGTKDLKLNTSVGALLLLAGSPSLLLKVDT